MTGGDTVTFTWYMKEKTSNYTKEHYCSECKKTIVTKPKIKLLGYWSNNAAPVGYQQVFLCKDCWQKFGLTEIKYIYGYDYD